MQDVVVTGASSMLGIALVNRCIENGTKVVAVVRPNSPRRGRIPVSPLVRVMEADLGGIARIASGLKGGCAAWYHLAWASTDRSGRNDPLLQKLNVDFTLSAVKAASDIGCRVFIGAGSQAEYGRVNGPIMPDMRVSPENAYGIAKYAAGGLSGIYARERGIDHIWVRVFSAYGPNDLPSTMIMYCISKLLGRSRPVLTKCEQMWDYIYCDDAARALYLLGDKGKNQAVYNLGSGKARPLSEYVYALRDAVDPGLEVGIGELEYAQDQVMHLCADISSLRRDTGFEPATGFAEGIGRTVKWARENRG
jgi:UDP-glucose 4-epimerase